MKFKNIFILLVLLFATVAGASATAVSVSPKIGWMMNNPSFEVWTLGTSNVAPDNWVFRYGGQSRSSDAPFGSYSLQIAGNGTDHAMGWIEQQVALGADTYTLSALTKITGRTAGYLRIQLYNKTTDTVYLSIDKQANSNWISSTSAGAYIADGNGNLWLRMYVNGSPNSGSNWFVDAVVLSSYYAQTMDETKDSSHMYQSFVWNTPQVFANDIWITAFSSYSAVSYNITATTVTVDGSATESFVAGDYNELIYFDLSGLSAASHTIVVTRTFSATPTIISTQAKWAPYLGSLASSGVDTLHAQTPGYYFFSGGHATRFMQTGYINSVKFYAQNVNEVSSFKISIWSEDENTLDCSKKYETVELSSSLVNGLNVLDFSSNPIPVEEGDAYCFYIAGTWNATAGIIPVTYAATGYSASVKWSQSPSTSNYHWMSQEGRNGSISVEFWGNAPDAVYTGDSIMCGHVNSFAFVTQMNNLATNDNYQMVLPYKVKQLNNWTYQNVGVSGDMFPNIADRFSNDVLSRNPKYAVIEGGVNNLASQNMGAVEIFNNYKKMIEAAQEKDVVPVIIKILPAYGHISNAEWSLKANEVADLLEAYHQENPNFVLVDARSVLGTNSTTTGWSLNPAYSCDSYPYVHLNEAGHSLLAQAIIDATDDQSGVNGLVYDSSNSQPIEGAVVYVYSENFSASYVTSSSGRYLFSNIQDKGVYYIQVTAKGYDTTPVSMAFNYDGAPLALDIALKRSDLQYAPADVTLIVEKGIWKQIVVGANISVESNGSVVKSGVTDSTGQFTVNNIEDGRLYNVLVTSDSYSANVSFWGSSLSKTYTIRLESSDFTPSEQKYNVVDAEVSQELVNSTTAKINATVVAEAGSLTNVTFVLGKYNTNGTFTQLDSWTTTDSGVLSSSSITHEFLVTNYSGESYSIGSYVTHSRLGLVVEWFSEQFKASNLPVSLQNSAALAWFGVFLLFIVAFQFGRADAPAGALMLVGFFYLLYNWGVFDGFGVSRTTQMIGGAVYAAAFAVMTYMIHKKNEQGA